MEPQKIYGEENRRASGAKRDDGQAIPNPARCPLPFGYCPLRALIPRSYAKLKGERVGTMPTLKGDY